MFNYKTGLLLAPTDDPTYLNLCDGTSSYDNIGIIPMIRGFQMFETKATLKRKTFTIFVYQFLRGWY